MNNKEKSKQAMICLEEFADRSLVAAAYLRHLDFSDEKIDKLLYFTVQQMIKKNREEGITEKIEENAIEDD